MKVMHEDIQIKAQKFVCYPEEGVCRMDLTGDKKALPSIDHAQAFALAKLAAEMEEYYGMPQDIEWAIDAGRNIYVLQCRPLSPKEAAPESYSSATAVSTTKKSFCRVASPPAPAQSAVRFTWWRRASMCWPFPKGPSL